MFGLIATEVAVCLPELVPVGSGSEFYFYIQSNHFLFVYSVSQKQLKAYLLLLGLSLYLLKL